MRISEMMNGICDDSVELKEQEVDAQCIKALVRQRMNAALPVTERKHPMRILLAVALAATMVLSLAATALAVSRGVSVAELLGGYFGGALNEEQQEVLEELGTTDFSGDSSEEAIPEEEAPLFSGVTRDGVTITPIAIVFDGYRMLFQTRITMSDGTPIPEEGYDNQYSLAVNLHIMDQVWCPAPVEEFFSKENCGENEIICTQDWWFCGEKVTLPDIINVVGLESSDHTTADNGLLFGVGDWPIDISKVSCGEEMVLKPEGQSVLRTIDNGDTDSSIDTVVTFTDVTLSPLMLNFTYAFEEALPAECDSYLNFDDPVVVMQDGTRITTHGGGGDSSPTGGRCSFRVDEPLILDQIEAVEMEGLSIVVEHS